MTETEAAAESQNGNETKTDDTSPENLNKVERQMNYYFGDYNYPRDKFLQQQAQLDDGWIPLEVMLKCARLKALTENASTVLLAIAQSKEGLLEVSEDKKKIRRAQPAPDVNEEAQLATQSRTAYCKGFPLDEKLDNLLEYFKQFGDCETVLMRHYRDKEAKTMKFKGSVFVVFKTDELAKKFMELESVEFNKTELIRKWQVDYFEEKKKERMEKIESKKSKPNKPVEREFKEESGNISLPKNSVLKIKDIPGDVTREDIKSALTLACPDVKIAFIEFDKGNPEAFIRLADEGSSPKAIEALGEGGKLVVCGVELVVEALSEEDEKPVLEKAEKFLNSRRMFGSKGRGGFKKGKRRGRGGFHGGKRARND